MRKAYLIMAHKNPKQVHRLISRLVDGESEFFIHIDKKVDFSPFLILKEFGPIVYFLERFDASWGRSGLIQPFLAGLRAVKKSSTAFQRIILLSGQDYPIKSNKEINDFLKFSTHSVFIKYFPIPNYQKWPGNDRGGWYRVDKYYMGSRWYQVLCSKTLNLLSTYLPLFKRKIPNKMKPFAGETWCIIDMYALDYIVNFIKKHPEYLTFHKYTYVADEIFLPMIIGNTKDQRLLNSIQNSENRFTIWDKPGSAHPKILCKHDLPAIIQSDDLFARKFETNVDEDVLNLIDDLIIFYKLPATKVV